MKVFLDTNILVAASVRQHPHFRAADRLFRRCQSGELEAVIHAHSLLEFHSALTQLPKGLSVPPLAVETILQEGILPYVRCVSLTAREVTAVQRRAGHLGLIGGVIYDLFHLAVAEEEKVGRLYTFNLQHFHRLASADFAPLIVSPD